MVETETGSNEQAEASSVSNAEQEVVRARPTERRAVRFTSAIRLAVSGGLLAWFAWRTDWDRVSDSFRGLRWECWFAAFGLYLICQIASAARWRILAYPLGFEGPLRRFAGLYFVGMYFNLMLPTSVGGDVARAWYLDSRRGRRLDAAVSVLFDRGSGLMVLLVMACVATLACPIRLPSWIPLCVLGTAVAAVVGIFALWLVAGRRGGRDRLGRLVQRSGLYLGSPRLILGTSLLSLVVQAGSVGLVWLIGLAIRAPVPPSFYWIFVPMVSLLTVLPLSVNGMGIREGASILFLSEVGVSRDAALCIAVLWFATMAAAGLCGGAVYLFSCYPGREVLRDERPLGGDSGQG
jgi:uncharacterized membrane protein YbhN (UPF0104 family)